MSGVGFSVSGGGYSVSGVGYSVCGIGYPVSGLGYSIHGVRYYFPWVFHVVFIVGYSLSHFDYSVAKDTVKTVIRPSHLIQ